LASTVYTLSVVAAAAATVVCGVVAALIYILLSLTKRMDEAQDATQTVGEKVPHGIGSLHIPSLQAGGGRGQSNEGQGGEEPTCVYFYSIK
jgi:hypothetical protein